MGDSFDRPANPFIVVFHFKHYIVNCHNFSAPNPDYIKRKMNGANNLGKLEEELQFKQQQYESLILGAEIYNPDEVSTIGKQIIVLKRLIEAIRGVNKLPAQVERMSIDDNNCIGQSSNLGNTSHIAQPEDNNLVQFNQNTGNQNSNNQATEQSPIGIQVANIEPVEAQIGNHQPKEQGIAQETQIEFGGDIQGQKEFGGIVGQQLISPQDLLELAHPRPPSLLSIGPIPQPVGAQPNHRFSPYANSGRRFNRRAFGGDQPQRVEGLLKQSNTNKRASQNYSSNFINREGANQGFRHQNHSGERAEGTLPHCKYLKKGNWHGTQ